ncbi:MAG TPA: HEAT repeat domain-containing protein [Gemmataceae bacterium]|nr:HEAT repeat domain-containing protein [Gemmataceae bacterium]
MTNWKTIVAAGFLAVLPSGVNAQLPATPPVGVPLGGPAAGGFGAPVAGGAVPAVPAAPTKNLWSFLFPSQAQKATFKQCLCSTQFGQMLTSSVQPLSMLSGGIVSGCCPPPNAADPAGLAQPPTSAEGAAARIKQSEADAAARRAAVRYLGTADCHRWPEAEAALINALRADPNECVRWQAAMSLGSGCCCTKRIIKALTLTVSCSNEDGNPVETSWRVKGAACAALQHCVSCYRDLPPPVPDAGRPEAPPPPARPEAPGVPLGPFQAKAPVNPDRQEMARIVEDARRALVRAAAQSPNAGHLPTGNHSMYHVVANAAVPEATPSLFRPPVETAPPPLLTEQPAGAALQPSRLPATGQRDLYHLFIHTSRPDGVAAQTNFVPSPASSNR